MAKEEPAIAVAGAESIGSRNMEVERQEIVQQQVAEFTASSINRSVNSTSAAEDMSALRIREEERQQADRDLAARLQEEEYRIVDELLVHPTSDDNNPRPRPVPQRPRQPVGPVQQHTAPPAPRDHHRQRLFRAFQSIWEDEEVVVQHERLRQEPITKVQNCSKNVTKSLLVEALECTVCVFSPIQSPIQQCRNGHLICLPCRRKVDKCPTCRVNPPWARNLMLEKLAESETVPCPVSPACGMRLWPNDVQAHKKLCEYLPVPCPCAPSCGVFLPMLPENITQHLVLEHGAIVRRTERAMVRSPLAIQLTINLPNVTKSGLKETIANMTMMSALGSQFIIWYELCEDGFFVWLQMAEPPATARDFAYKLCWEQKGHSVCYTGPVPSVTRKADSVKAAGEFLSVPWGMVIASSSNASSMISEVELFLGIKKVGAMNI